MFDQNARISVNLRELEDGRAYRCVLSEKELREAYKNVR